MLDYHRTVLDQFGLHLHVTHKHYPIHSVLIGGTYGQEQLRQRWLTAFQKFLQSDDAGNLTRAEYQALQRTLDHMSPETHQRSYFVKHCWRLQPESRMSRNGVLIPFALRPINVILVQLLTEVSDKEFRTIIADAFDFEHCRVALHINEDLTFGYDMPQEAEDNVTSKKLGLRGCAFGERTLDDAIHNQLRRTSKYIRRGFVW